MDNKYLNQLTKEAGIKDALKSAGGNLAHFVDDGVGQLALAPITHMAAHHAATKGGKQAFDAGSYAKSISPALAVGAGGTALAVGAVKAIKALRAAKAAKGATTPEEASGIKRLLAKVGIGSAVGAGSAAV